MFIKSIIKKGKMVIKSIKLVLLLAVLYVSIPSLSWTEEPCRSVFNEITEKLKKVDINQYKDQEGYVRLTEEFKDTTNMADIFDKVFEILDKKQMRVLRWKKFQGTVSEFYKLMDKILHDDNSIRREHQDLGGFLKLAKQYFSNDFLKTYRNVSAVLDKDQMIELGWQKLKKTILDFNRFAKPLLNKDASIKDEYKGREGYIRFVEELEGIESMEYVFSKVSKVLDSVKMKELQWQQFQGTSLDFKNLKDLLSLDVIEKYKGMAGYVLFAKKYFKNNMEKAYKNVSAVLGGGGSRLMKQLDWQEYIGLVSEFNKLRENILNKDGSIKEEYKGSDGYVNFAKEHFESDMQKAYQNVSAVLGGGGSRLMNQLDWQQYQGLVSDFKKLRNKILNKDGSIKEQYKGSNGYVNFSKEHFESDMQKTYQNVSAVLGGGGSRLMNQLDWQQYQGSVSDFKKLRENILNKDGSIKEEYKGSNGYVNFSKEHFESDMQKAYQNVSAVLGGGGSRLMNQLDWQQYQGSVSDFKKLRDKILNKDGSIKEEYKGSNGYVNFAKEHFESDMQKAYQNVSAVLGGGGSRLMKQLDWQQYQGSVSDFKKLRENILNKDGSIKEEYNRFAKPLLNKDASIKDEYKGREGYIRFVEELEGIESMEYVFSKVSKVLDTVKMKELQWQQFRGTSLDFKNLKDLLSLDVIEKYKGMAGYVLFAKKYFKNNMQKAYKNVSAVLGGGDSRLMKQLDWQEYIGLVSEFNKLRENILNKDGSIKEEYKGSDGYVKFAKNRFKSDMKKAYQNVSAVLGGGGSRLMKQLDWQQYQGLVSDFKKLRNKILNKDGSIKEQYKGSNGYVNFAKEHFESDMKKAYQNVSAVLGGGGSRLMKQLDWQQYQGLVSEFNKLREKILNKDGSIKEQYKGSNGYVNFVKEHFESDMQKAYQNVSAVLGGGGSRLMKQLDWQQYQGSVSDFNKLKDKILNKDGSIKEEYKGSDGYVNFVKKYFEGNMQKAYQNVSSVLGGGSRLMNQLDWQMYQGQVSDFSKIRDKILNKDGLIKEEYKGMDGYIKFAEEYFNGNMHKAYQNVSVVLGGVLEMRRLNIGWKKFQGTVDQFKDLKDLFESIEREELKGEKGQLRVAREIFKGNKERAYSMVSVVLGGGSKLMKQLDWQGYHRQVSEFNKIRDKILNEDGLIREEYKGILGYVKFAEEYFNGNMHKAYQNVSVVLGGVLEMRILNIGWKQFQGTVDQFKDLKVLFESIEREELKGEKGQLRVAREIFKGNKERAYGMVSALKEYLLGSKEAFKELGWKK